jgi:hypothetical protein
MVLIVRHNGQDASPQIGPRIPRGETCTSCRFQECVQSKKLHSTVKNFNFLGPLSIIIEQHTEQCALAVPKAAEYQPQPSISPHNSFDRGSTLSAVPDYQDYTSAQRNRCCKANQVNTFRYSDSCHRLSKPSRCIRNNLPYNEIEHRSKY